MFEQIDIELIKVPNGRRPVDAAAVESLVASISKIGLRTPLTVLDENDGRELVLVTGHHRLQALRKLGFEKANCFVMESNKVEAELWEISENLHRSDLTTLQRDEQVSRWIELSDAISPQVVEKSTAGRPQGGVSSAARELNVNREDARRATKVASISERAKAAAQEVGLDNNRKVLLETAKLPEEDQETYIREVAEQKKVAREKVVQKANLPAVIDTAPHDRAVELQPLLATFAKAVTVLSKAGDMPVSVLVDALKELPPLPAKPSTKGVRIPDGYEPDISYANERGITGKNAFDMAEDFLDYWSAKAGKDALKVDWDATWKRWVRSDFNGVANRPNNSNAPARNDRSGLSSTARLVLEMAEGRS